jgi:D-psicose/D-tagatose/L-ribulose 3-epimerase
MEENMKVGFNMLLWASYITEKEFPLFEKLKKAGYDGVEIPVTHGTVDEYKRMGKVIADQDLEATVAINILDEEHNPISPDPKHRQGGVDYMKWSADCAEALGAKLVVGPFYQVVGVFSGSGPTEEEKQRAAEVHRKAADYASNAGIVFAVEPLNRFECYFLNTVGDTAAYARMVDRPNFFMMYDAFHANIEEKDPVGCILRNIDMIKHVHTSENDRGTPGKGHNDWKGIFSALKKGGYDGWLTIEAFGRLLPDFAVATRTWRDHFSSPEEVYRDGIRFIREQWKEAY